MTGPVEFQATSRVSVGSVYVGLAIAHEPRAINVHNLPWTFHAVDVHGPAGRLSGSTFPDLQALRRAVGEALS